MKEASAGERAHGTRLRNPYRWRFRSIELVRVFLGECPHPKSELMNIVSEGFNALVIHGLKQIVDGPALDSSSSFAAILQPAM